QWWGQGAFFQSMRWLFLSAILTFVAMAFHKRPADAPPPVRLRSSGIVWGIVVFIVWVCVQGAWALDLEEHGILFWTWVKFFLAFIMICKCIETEQHLRAFMWTH